MSDQSEPTIPDVAPSIPHGPEARHTDVRAPDYKGLYEHAMKMMDGVLEAMHTHGITLDTFNTDMRQPAEWNRGGSKYNIWRQLKAPMGS